MTSPVALVTGAARGIGLAITQSLIAAGYRVMAADLGTDQAWNYQLGQSADIAQALQAANPSTDNAPPYAVCTVDVTNAEACEQAVQKTIETFGQLNLLVNNAGIVDSGPNYSVQRSGLGSHFRGEHQGHFSDVKGRHSASFGCRQCQHRQHGVDCG